MRPLTPKEFFEVMKFVQNYHRFAYWPADDEWEKILSTYPLMPHHGLSIKYIDSCYDSRDGSVWSISFRGMGGNVRFSANHFNFMNEKPKSWKYESLYELIMAYLTGQFVPKEEFYFDHRDDATNTRKMYGRQEMINLFNEFMLDSSTRNFESWLDKKEGFKK